ncbi:MAG: ribonuclease P protein component [Planctomycetota bacterium]|jgi:ribonuclease P protein component|nr:ribonuclease P protein component [Planctomycetota bacterium]
MENLPRAERLHGQGAVGALFESGFRAAAGVVAVRALANGLDRNRVAAIAGRATGNAVKRNRQRRRLRAAYRAAKKTFPAGWDLAILARRGLLETSWAELTRDLGQAVEKAIAVSSGGRPRPPRRT